MNSAVGLIVATIYQKTSAGVVVRVYGVFIVTMSTDMIYKDPQSPLIFRVECYRLSVRKDL